MKTFAALLGAAVVLSLGSAANAGVFVHAGPVHVAVGVPHRPAWPVAPRPVVRPVAVRPVIAPVAPVQNPLFLPAPVVGRPGPSISPHEAREIREEARELRHEIRDAGRVITPHERHEIREEARELGQEIRHAMHD